MGLFGKFFGSKKAPAQPVIQTQAPQYDVMDFTDEITGTETVTVTDASGKKKRITRRLPRSAEEQKIYDNATKLFNDSLNNIEALSVIDPSQAAEFAPYLQAYKGKLDRSLTEAVNRTRASLESNFVKAGLQDSTAATELRTALARDEMQQRGQLDEQVRLRGEDMRDKQLARQYGLMEVGANLRGQDLNTAMAGKTANLMQQEYALDNQRFTNNANAQLANYSMQLQRFNTPNKVGFGQELLRAAARGGVNMMFGGGFGSGRA
jgi:hypothetical protein